MRRLAAVTVTAALVLATATAAAEPVAYTTAIEAGGCQLHSIDVTTGVATPVGALQTDCMVALARSADGTLWSIALDDAGAATLVTLDLTTGAPTAVGPVGISVPVSGGGSFLALTVDPDGVVWLAANSEAAACPDGMASSCLYRLDATTGAGTLVGGTDQLLAGLAATCDDGLLATSWPDSSLYTVDEADGSTTAVGALGITSPVQGAGTGPDGRVWGMAAQLAEFPFHTVTIDPATGAATTVAAVSGFEALDAGGLALVPQVCAAPLEPTTTTGPAAAPALAVNPSFTG